MDGRKELNGKIQIVIVTHGELVYGLHNTAEMLLGDLPEIKLVSLTPSEGPEDLQKRLKEIINTSSNDMTTLFMVDIWGGTPCNQVLLLNETSLNKNGIVSGINLPMLIEAYTLKEDFENANLLANYLYSNRDNYVSINQEENHQNSTETLVEQEKNEGNINVVLCRIDSRLLHGQVATAWTRETSPDRIIIVSDTVVRDNLRKRLLEQAAPPNVKVNVISIDKLVELLERDDFGKVNVLLLFENPQDVLVAHHKGAKLYNINLGSMAHSKGKVMVNKALSMDSNDINTFKELLNLGVSFDVRKVPSDNNQMIDTLILKAKKELALKEEE